MDSGSGCFGCCAIFFILFCLLAFFCLMALFVPVNIDLNVPSAAVLSLVA